MIEASLLAGALNHLLRGAAWAPARLVRHAGKRVLVAAAPFDVFLSIGPGGNFVPADDGPIDAAIRLPEVFSPLEPSEAEAGTKMAEAEPAGEGEFQSELVFVLRHLRWDVEEDLSRLLGDIAAHRLAAGVSRLNAWRKQALTALACNLAEFWSHEHPMLLPAAEYRQFHADVERFAMRLSALEARMQKHA